MEDANVIRDAAVGSSLCTSQQEPLPKRGFEETTTTTTEGPDGNHTTTTTTKNTKKRKRNQTIEDMYKGYTFTAIPSTGRPGTPHRFFAETYWVEHNQSSQSLTDLTVTDDSNTTSTTTTTTCSNTAGSCAPYNRLRMQVHRHANGLCVVTTGDQMKITASTMNDVVVAAAVAAPAVVADNNNATTENSNHNKGVLELLVKEAPVMSLAQKRKRLASMLKGKKILEDGIVCPSDPLISLAGITFPATVFGSLLEFNPNLTVDLARRDPLFQGYLAVILPAGCFPPPTSFESTGKYACRVDQIEEEPSE